MSEKIKELHKIFISKEDEAFYRKKQAEFYKNVENIIHKYQINLQSVLTHPTSFMQRRNLPKFLALYEIFKITLDMPGSIAECGVFMGGSLFTWLHLLETFLPGERMKKIYAFDHFKGYDRFENEDSDAEWVRDKHNGTILDDVNGEMIADLIQVHNLDSYLPGVERVIMVPGDITVTAPAFKKENMGVRFAIINVDVNLYNPVMAILENFYDLLLPGGIMMFSGYTAPPWSGEASAIEDFFSNKKILMKKFPFSPYPRAYFVKE